MVAGVYYQRHIKIGQQIFMAQNLNVSLFRNGDPILEVKTIEEWKNANNLHLPASCTYNFDPANGIKYGKLYNWYAVSDSRGLAPAGWHVPKSEEWVLLSNELGGSGRAGNYMKSLSAWDLEHGLTKSGFHGLPGGYLNMNNKDGFTSIGTFGLWSTATEIDTEKSEYRYLEMDKTDLYNIKSFKHFGASVRCIKD